ncbi:MAG: carboxypeptidase regulatory-like domain-containing protein [Bryobacterales bacterium]|nr:carboxypeptidase regulatory-like domain-containing protein [Bryobacterales bacterium]
MRILIRLPKLVFVTLVVIAAWLHVIAPALAQTGQGSIVGSVTDATSAAVPGVSVRARNTQTGFAYSSITNQEGIYRIPYVNPGTYELTCEVQGFKKLTHGNILVRSTETARVDVTLEVGSLVESVEVKAETPLLEAETSATGHLAPGEVVNTLPTPQQKMQSILFYMPGVTAQKGEGHGVGQRSRSFVISMDGVSSMEPVRGAISTTTTLYTTEENIGEVKVLTTALPAEYGHSGGAVMNIAFKGGTNQVHGLAEERYLGKSMLHLAGA